MTSFVQTDTRQMSALFKQPDQMLQFLLESRTSEQAAMKQRCSRVVNVMLNSALVLLSQQHSKQAPVHAIHSVVKALIVLQVCTFPVCMFQFFSVTICHRVTLYSEFPSCLTLLIVVDISDSSSFLVLCV